MRVGYLLGGKSPGRKNNVAHAKKRVNARNSYHHDHLAFLTFTILFSI